MDEHANTHLFANSILGTTFFPRSGVAASSIMDVLAGIEMAVSTPSFATLVGMIVDKPHHRLSLSTGYSCS